MSSFHARTAFGHLAGLRELGDAENVAAAAAHALLSIDGHLGEIAQQLRLANVIGAFDAGIEAEGHPLEMGIADIHAAIVYLQGRIVDIVNPESEKH